MFRSLLVTAFALLLTSTAHGMDSWVKKVALEADDPAEGQDGDFYQALLGAFLESDGGAWGPGENPDGWESPDPDEIIIEPGDLLPGPSDNGNCTDWYWEVPETRGCG